MACTLSIGPIEEIVYGRQPLQYTKEKSWLIEMPFF